MPSPNMSTAALAQAFCDRTLPKSLWTHEAHLRVGLWHLLHASEEFALDKSPLDNLRERIRSYNEATGVANTSTSGYHETLTRFYVWLIGRFLEQADQTLPEDILADQLVHRLGNRELPLQFWSREVLMSPLARKQWVEPDRLTGLEASQQTDLLLLPQLDV